MIKKYLTKAIVLATVSMSLMALNSIGASAKSVKNEIDTMKNIIIQFDTGRVEHVSNDVADLYYVDDDGEIYCTGDVSRVFNPNGMASDSLAYIDHVGYVQSRAKIDAIFYTDKNGKKCEIGDSELIKEVVDKDNKSTESTTKTGWIKEGDKWTYRYSNGEKCYGWLKDDDNWYYFNRNGNMQQDGMFKIDGKVYLFDSNGRLQEDNAISENVKKTGWVKEGIVSPTGQDWRYVYSNGENCVGWLQDEGYWYYFDKCGHMVKNQMRKIDGKVYSFDSKGHIKLNTTEYPGYTQTYLNHTGPTDGSGFVCNTYLTKVVSDETGVCTITGLHGEDIDVGNMLFRKDAHYLNDGSYHGILFDKNGDQVFGWFLESTYVSSDVATGITILADKWTYYDENGVQVISASKVIDGKTYSFDSKGYLV